MRYVGLLLRQAHVEDAARESEAIETPAMLATLLADRSYTALWDHPSIAALLAPEALVARVERSVQLRLEQKVISIGRLARHDARAARDRAAEGGGAARLACDERGAQRDRARPEPRSRLELGYAYLESGEAWAARRTARELLREDVHSDAATQIAVAQLLIAAGDNEAALALASAIKEEFAGRKLFRRLAARSKRVPRIILSRLNRRDEALGRSVEAQKADPEAAFGALHVRRPDERSGRRAGRRCWRMRRRGRKRS